MDRPSRLLAVLALLAVAAGLGAARLEPVTYDDSEALAEAWVNGNAEAVTPTLKTAEGTKFARFALPFAALKDWRFTWDHAGKWDLAKAERLVLKVRCGGHGSCGQGILYAHSGAGWYVLSPFGSTPQWREVVLEKARASVEGSPAGWAQVDAFRLSLMPGSGEAHFDLAWIDSQAALPESWVWEAGGAKKKETVFGRILNQAEGQGQEDARHRLSQAEGILAKAREWQLGGEQRKQALHDARAKVAEAYALSQAPLPMGVRAVWVHHGDGPTARSGKRAARWKDAIPAMHAMGINTVFPNMLWSGVAFYPSKLVANAPEMATEGDYLKEILDAAKPLGMKVHVWKVMWQFAEGWLAPVGASEPFRKEGRLQLDKDGKEQPWLCPCDERNRKFEMDALLEVAGAYDIDGIHLDYIRFESPESGFGSACKARFEAWSGKKVERWPADCAPGGPWAEAYGDFKRELISSFVHEAHDKLKALKPGLQLSAAVFSYPELARKQVFQDWPRWVKEGWVDFVSPMTYTEDAASFAAATKMQADLVGADKLLPGMQIVFDGGRVAALESVVDQIKAAAKLGTRGINLFEWREHLQDTVLPYVRNGLWREGPYRLQFRTVPAEQLPPKVQAGRKLDVRPKAKQVLIDDFEDGNLVNALHAPWTAEADSNGLGTRLDGQPLRPLDGGARGSRHALGLKGHFGANRAPWPYASLATAFNPDRAPTDLGPYRTLVLKARGDGKPVDVVIGRAVVKDYGNFRAQFTPGPQWQEFRLPMDDFSQPAWAEPVPRGFSDATTLQFQPGGRDDADFEFQIDDVKLLR